MVIHGLTNPINSYPTMEETNKMTAGSLHGSDKIKKTSGRHKLPPEEKKLMIRVFVKKKHHSLAKTEIKEIEKKYAELA